MTEMPTECQKWLSDFRDTIAKGSPAKSCHALCMMGFNDRAEEREKTSSHDGLRWTAIYQDAWNAILLECIPINLRKKIAAYIRRDICSDSDLGPDYGKHFLKSWSRWVLTQLR